MAQGIYQLLQDQNILQEKGFIEIHLAGQVLCVKDKSPAGNLLQEWFGTWLNAQDVQYPRIPRFYVTSKAG